MVDASERIIILSALLLVVILGGVRVWYSDNQDQIETTIDTTESNIIFRYGISGGKHPNELDTFKGIFTKDMVNKDPVTTKLDLTQEEMDTIHRMIVEIDFFSYPTALHRKLEGDIYSSSSSFMVYSIEYHNGTGRKFVYWTSQYTPPKDLHYQNLKELANLIIEIIQAKPEYQKLPKPTAGYV
jgi:hypothetical protein